MMRKKTILALAAAMMLAVGVALIQSNRLEAAELSTDHAKPAPAWKLKDLAGQDISSDQFKGKVVVVDFWATWCPPCVGEIPGYVELQKKYGAQGLAIVGISLDQQGPEVVKKFADAKKINYTIVMGDDEVAAAFGGVQAIPTTFLIDRSGKIVHSKRGAMEHSEYEKLVVQALK